MHAVGLSKKGYAVKFYTDTSTLDPNWVRLLRQSAEVRDLPYGLAASDAIREMGQADCILIHHHVEPLVAFRIALKYGYKTCIYVGDLLTRAVWERQLTGRDYRQFSPSVFKTARYFYGPISTLALRGSIYNLTTATLRVLDRMTTMRCGMVVANSYYTAEIIRRLLGYRGPIPVVYPASGIPSSMFQPNYDNGDYILSVGALAPHKNHQILLKALSTLEKPPPLFLIGDGQEAGSLRYLARKLSVSVRFLPFRAQDEALCRLYEQSLFVTVSSISEAFGMTPVEGALAGKPSVVGATGGTREFVVNGETGLVVNSTSQQQMGDAIQILIEDSGLRRTMGQRARERALGQFSVDNSVSSMAEALKELANN